MRNKRKQSHKRRVRGGRMHKAPRNQQGNNTIKPNFAALKGGKFGKNHVWCHKHNGDLVCTRKKPGNTLKGGFMSDCEKYKKQKDFKMYGTCKRWRRNRARHQRRYRQRYF